MGGGRYLPIYGYASNGSWIACLVIYTPIPTTSIAFQLISYAVDINLSRYWWLFMLIDRVHGNLRKLTHIYLPIKDR